MEFTQIYIDIELYRILEQHRKSFEESHNEILRRLLQVEETQRPSKLTSSKPKGLAAKDILLPEGLKMRRKYKGKMLEAHVADAAIIYNGEKFTSPSSAASKATDTNVNGWVFWNYFDVDSQTWHPLEQLRNRNQEAICRTERQGNKPTNGPHGRTETMRKRTWLEWIVEALTRIGGKGELNQIYREVEKIHPGPLTSRWDATVRHVIECHSADSKNFNGRNIFYSVEGLHRGIWGLNSMRKNRE